MHYALLMAHLFTVIAPTTPSRWGFKFTIPGVLLRHSNCRNQRNSSGDTMTRLLSLAILTAGLIISHPLPASDSPEYRSQHYLWPRSDSRLKRRINPAPQGLKLFVVYMANGYVDLNETDPELPPNMVIVPQAPGMLIGTFFHEVIMCRSQEQIEEHRLAAIEYFYQLFRLEPSDYAIDPANPSGARLILLPYMVDPRLNFRVYSSTGERISRRGVHMRDGGWIAQVIDPEGYQISNGDTIPAGSTFRYGDYNMRMDRIGERDFYQLDECYQEFPSLILKFATREPMIQDPSEPAKILVRDNVWYKGKNGTILTGDGRGGTRPVFTEDGKFSLQTRSMITFPPSTSP